MKKTLVDPKNALAVVADDSEAIVKSVLIGFEFLCGFPPNQIKKFDEIDQTKNFFDYEYNRNQPCVAVLDNNTPRSRLDGLGLSLHLLNEDKFPNLTVVTVSSSDLEIVTRDEGRVLRELRAAGGEFWAKHTERHLVMLWIADCLREGRRISRNDWLEERRIDVGYKALNALRGPEEQELFYLFDDLQYAKNPAQVLAEKGLSIGDGFRLGSREVLSRLGFPPRSIEGKVVQSGERR